MNRGKKSLVIETLAAFIIMVFIVSFRCASPEKDALPKVQKLLTEMKVYDYGQSRESLTSFSDLLKSVLGSPDVVSGIEKEMINFLKSDATFAGKQFICQQLSIIGTDESVPVLAEMLSVEQTADIALYALERIPGTAVNNALNEALPKAAGKVKIGVINSLGQRKDTRSVVELDKLLYDSDAQIAQSAAAALGKIADNAAVSALEKAKSKITGPLRMSIVDAYLKCADNLVQQENRQQASAIYRDIYDKEENIAARAAALEGLINSNKEEAVVTILSAIKGNNSELQSVAMGSIRNLPKSADLKKITAEFGNLSTQEKVQLLTALGDRNEVAALQAVRDAVKNPEEIVRVAALKTLAKIGDKSDVDLLARSAAEATGADRLTAQESLNLLRGPAVDNYVLAQIPNTTASIKLALIQSVGERNIPNAEKTILTAAADPAVEVRRESMKTLASVAQPEYINELIQILIKEENGSVRSEAERAVVAVAQKIKDENNQAKPVLQILPSVQNSNAKISLLQVLGKIGDKNALPELRNALKNENADFQAAGIRALSSWPTTEPIPDLLSVAKTSTNEINKILALRGFIDLLKLEKDKPDQELLNQYLTALDLATEPNEKRMVLSGIATLHSMPALETAARYLGDSALQREAEVAVVTLAQNVRDGDKKRITELLNKILADTKNSNLRERITNMLKRTN